MSLGKVEKNITAQNTFSDPISIRGKFNLSISGTWAATVFLQRSFDNGANYVDVESYTANIEKIGEELESGILYRVGVKTGGFTSGTVVCRLSQ